MFLNFAHFVGVNRKFSTSLAKSWFNLLWKTANPLTSQFWQKRSLQQMWENTYYFSFLRFSVGKYNIISSHMRCEREIWKADDFSLLTTLFTVGKEPFCCFVLPGNVWNAPCVVGYIHLQSNINYIYKWSKSSFLWFSIETLRVEREI
jgi:hypothetical protein